MTGVNMLEQMASGLIEEKQEKGRGLTPLVSERLMTPASFPNDLPEDAIRGIIGDLQRQHDNLGEVITAMRLLVKEPVPVAPAADTQREKERAADARVAAITAASETEPEADLVEALKEVVATEQETFDANLAAQTAAAQAATFTPEPTAAPAPSGWACPNGHDTVEEKVSPRGRQFARCSTCGAFQK